MSSEALKTARAVLGVLVCEAEKAERALAALKLNDETLALAVMAQARALRLAAEESQRLVDRISSEADRAAQRP